MHIDSVAYLILYIHKVWLKTHIYNESISIADTTHLVYKEICNSNVWLTKSKYVYLVQQLIS